TIKDYQASSLLMAILLNGLNKQETYYLTNAMQHSGEQIKLNSNNDRLIIDKHSSGGIGDKVTLILTPIIAALGYDVAKMSGRGLSFTGGTIDKLESINANSEFDLDCAQKLMNKYGMFIMSQTDKIVPADKKIYSLRDVSGTVESIPLIASSIMSKKLCINSDYLFLDIKVGSGAFFKTLKEANTFCEYTLYVAKQANKKTSIHLTNMDIPLGFNIGNKLEVIEAINYLDNRLVNSYLDKLIVEMAADILLDTNRVENKKQAISIVREVINSKKALNKLLDYLKAVDSDLDLLNYNSWFNPKFSYEIYAEQDGYLDFENCKEIGLVSLYLGAGRKTKSDKIDFDAGIVLNKEYNQYVKSGDLIATLYSNSKISNEVIELFKKDLKITKKPNKNTKIIY
ncbi:MAG: thymidine phosphorylase, partial [Ureaplasma sp.]|nr:thymidine phosphorylase [Ureaplasma sp.]